MSVSFTLLCAINVFVCLPGLSWMSTGGMCIFSRHYTKSTNGIFLKYAYKVKFDFFHDVLWIHAVFWIPVIVIILCNFVISRASVHIIPYICLFVCFLLIVLFIFVFLFRQNAAKDELKCQGFRFFCVFMERKKKIHRGVSNHPLR